MANSIGMVNLGCDKNRIDGEIMLASLAKAGWEIRENAACCDVAVVNTCGFIKDAKQESINEILELAQAKKAGKVRAIVVTGCLAERYQKEILQELPECDAVCGIGADGQIDAVCRKALLGEKTSLFPEKTELPLCGVRRLTTPGYYAYLKIAEGCDNRCSYCAIPMIRGRYRSRPMESIEEEARELVKSGVKELILIAQDTTRYGIDLEGKLLLPQLMRRLCKIDGLRWLRVLYCYPDNLTDELLDTIREEKKVVKYLDLPLQHCSGSVLHAMHRYGDREKLTKMIFRIREKVPGITLRTTFIVGFPGETEEDFEELCSFSKEIEFERMGCFTYSQEEGTEAAALSGQIEEDEKMRRQEILMEAQMNRMQELGESKIGERLLVLCEGYDQEEKAFFGRTQSDAPEIDGRVWFEVTGESNPNAGDFVKVKVTDCIDCDLIGVLSEGGNE